jgi:hypothetical protein
MIDKIKKYYTKAIRTALLAHDKEFDKWYHIISIIELQPIEIQSYNIVDTRKGWHKTIGTSIVRSTISTDLYTFSLVIQEISVENGISIFEHPFQNNIFDKIPNHYFNEVFVKEPSGISPLVLPSNMYGVESIGSIIPKRNSGVYVWSQIDNSRVTEKLFRSEPISKDMKAMSQLTNDWLGFDLWMKPEHIGNIYLVMPNPYYRDIDLMLSHNPKGIFYHVKLRKGINEQLKIRIQDTHGDYIALDKLCEIANPIGLIELPHEPHSVELKIYNGDNDLIGLHGPSVFLKSIQLDINIKQADFQVNIQDETGKKKEFVVEKFSRGTSSTIGNALEFNSSYYFKTAENKRKHVSNKEKKDFIFFKAVQDEEERKEQKEEAQSIIVELINKAKYKCYICDPYFDSSDLIDFGFRITNISTELKILSSTEIGKEKAKDLLTVTSKYNEKPFQKIEVRILYSNVLHDRFIISDDDVWFIGSSLNHIGSKATCIVKVPKSDDVEITKETEKWFSNKGGNYSQSLEEYVNSTT